MATFPVTQQRSFTAGRSAAVVGAVLALCLTGGAFSLHRAAAAEAPSPAAVVTLAAESFGHAGAVAGVASGAANDVAPTTVRPADLAGFYLPSVSAGPASGLETRLFDGLNHERVAQGLNPFATDAELSRIARIRARQMADQGYFAHVDRNGYTMYTELLALSGVSYAWAGENLAVNSYPDGESAARAVASLMRSPAHRENILAGDFDRVGIGEFSTADGSHIYAMVFLG